MRDLEFLADEFLEWLDTTSGSNTGMSVDLSAFSAKAGLELTDALALVRQCAAQGWVIDANAMGEAAAILQLAGVRKAQEFRARRDDPRLRSAAARRAVLTYIHQQEFDRPTMPFRPESSRPRAVLIWERNSPKPKSTGPRPTSPGKK